MALDDVRRFWNKVNKNTEDGCWLWTGFIAKSGYGIIAKKNASHIRAHRFSYELKHNIKLSAGKMVYHTCENRHCVNPDHLTLIDPYERLFGRDINDQKKLTDEDVLVIKQKLAEGISGSAIAREYNVSRELISQIKLGKRK